MKLVSLKVQNVGVLKSIDIPEFSPNLTIIHGPNETGKTTLYRALRAALFERHDAGHEGLKKLQPMKTNLAPEVWVTIECRGQRYEIHKRFLDKPYSKLTIHGTPERCFEGDAADEQIRNLMECERPTNRGAKPEQMGIWPLLWMEQGQSGQGLESVMGDGIRNRLDDVLRKVVGDVTGGPRGGLLLDAARGELRKYYTEQRRQPTGALAEAIDAAARADEHVKKSRTDLESSRQLAEELQQTCDSLKQDQENLTQARLDRDAAAEKLAELTNRELQLERATITCKNAQTQWEQAHDRASRRKAQIADIETRRQEFETRENHVRSLEQQIESSQAKLAEATTDLDAREQALKQAQAHLQKLQNSRQRHHLQTQSTTTNEQLAKAETLTSAIQDYESQLRALTITNEHVEKLVQSELEVDKARAGITNIAAKLTITAQRAIGFTEDDAPPRDLAEGESRDVVIDRQHRFTLGDFASITVEPGGGDVTKRLRKLAQLEEAHRDLLAECGVNTLLEARQSAKERNRIEAESRERSAQLEVVAPQGMEILYTERRRLQNELERLGQADSAPEDIDTAISSAERDLTASTDQVNDARLHHDTARKAHEDLLRVRERLQGELTNARTELDREEGKLSQDRGNVGDEALQSERQRLFNIYQREQGAVEVLSAALNAMNPDLIKDEARRTATVVQALDKRVRDLTAGQAELTGQIRQAGSQGLYDLLNEAESAFARADARKNHLERQANAAARLFDALSQARSEVQKKLVEPIIKEIGKLLRNLLPGCEATIDESLVLSGLKRKGVEEPFDLLSAGLREQLATLTRLAMACILADGRPLPVILDDSLVCTDDQRFANMLTILRRASKDLQIIMLTCHRDRYMALGTEQVLDLAALKRANNGRGGTCTAGSRDADHT